MVRSASEGGEISRPEALRLCCLKLAVEQINAMLAAGSTFPNIDLGTMTIEAADAFLNYIVGEPAT